MLTVTDVSVTCAVVIVKVKVSCITSMDGIKLWLLTWLVNYVALLLVICQLSHDVIGYEDSKLVHFNLFIVRVKQSVIVSQAVGCPVILL